MHIALWEPEIPPNTGNIARLCAATATPLHLIGRLGFQIDDRQLRRAGLDYWPHVELHRHPTYADFKAWWATTSANPGQIHCLSARASQPYTAITFQAGDCLLFGSETRGLPSEIVEQHQGHLFGIPMPGGKVRSLNLATAVGIVLYEGLRQLQSW